ncbi:hypothetical protein RND81_02G137200 [Saponaria officinalis]|uniref:Uncharacterized protein n=1 Tax=Saponaria officinalis TaxID=3572 RepID=A0AAW1MVJ0_SAPOF
MKNVGTETIQHIVFLCPYTRAVVEGMANCFHLSIPYDEDLVLWCHKQRMSRFRKRVLSCAFKACYYGIWHQRNHARIHSELLLPRGLVRHVYNVFCLRIRMVPNLNVSAQEVSWFQHIISASM